LKLGKRLKQIDAMAGSGYDHIWDCCCDHGLLGAALLARKAAPAIHFVDVVPEIMRQVENKLQRFYPQSSQSADDSQWRVHCLDAAALPLQAFSGKHLIIIAGIGGELMAELINAIDEQHAATDMDFLLCPMRHPFALRQQLIERNFSLKTEVLVKENRRFYEILWVSSRPPPKTPEQKIHPAGSLLWQATNAEQQNIVADYLHKTLNHYKRIQLNYPSQAQPMIEAYSAVRL